MTSFAHYLGCHETRLETPGRIQLPKALSGPFTAQDADPRLVASLGPHGCITLWSYDDWNEHVLRKLDSENDEDRRQVISMQLGSQAMRTRCDRPGRVMVNEHLRAEAGLDSPDGEKVELVIVGGVRQIHVWKKERWLHFQENGFRHPDHEADPESQRAIEED